MYLCKYLLERQLSQYFLVCYMYLHVHQHSTTACINNTCLQHVQIWFLLIYTWNTLLQLQSPCPKRKDSENDIDMTIKRKKIKQEDSTDSASSSPLPSPAIRDPEKWNPARLTQETLFIMGSHAHKVCISFILFLF